MAVYFTGTCLDSSLCLLQTCLEAPNSNCSHSRFKKYGFNLAYTVFSPTGRWIFILEGLFNVAVALFTFSVLPRFPAESTFLSPEEKARLLERLAIERGDEVESFKGQPWLSYVFDWQTWLNIVVYFGADISAAAISQFSPTIINQMGYTANQANLVSLIKKNQ